MILKLFVQDLDDILDDLTEICEDLEPVFTDEDEDGNYVDVSHYRIVVPKAKHSFRFGEPYSDDEPWGDMAVVTYEENEKDINKYISYANCGLETMLHYEYKCEDCECYIDTSEFIDDASLIDMLDDGDYSSIAELVERQ